MAKCTERLANGKRCKANALRGKRLCFTHDPTIAEQRRSARARGGRIKRSDREWPVKVRSLDDILILLDRTLADTVLQENTSKRSAALVAMARAYSQAIEAHDLEGRLVDVERRLNRGKLKA